MLDLQDTVSAYDKAAGIQRIARLFGYDIGFSCDKCFVYFQPTIFQNGVAAYLSAALYEHDIV